MGWGEPHTSRGVEVPAESLRTLANTSVALTRQLNASPRPWPDGVGELVRQANLVAARAGVCPWGSGVGGSLECQNHCSYAPEYGCTAPGAASSWDPPDQEG